jgi:Secretion system C-terminal sorting domain/Copper type II ascorbate-dependent monooxygenase, C-terminal domain
MKKISTFLLLTGLYFGHQAQAQTFNQDIAPIMFSKCTSCHNPNGANSGRPFTNYLEVSGSSHSIASYVGAGLMPPWPPDTTYNTFLHQHERTLTEVEKNKIMQWVTNGVPEGTGTAPVCPSYTTSNRLAGKADLVVGTGLVKSNASPSNTNPYNCFVIPAGLTEGRWLRAVEIVPGDLKVVHHVVVTVDTNGTATSDMSGACNNQPGQFGIAGWSSGAAPVVYPSKAPLKAGQWIPKKSAIVLQMHYAPGSDGMNDSTKVRLYFYDKDSVAGIRQVNDQVVLQYWGFPGGGIPANKGLWLTANPGFGAPGPPANTDISILAVNPHSHFVCTKIINYAFSGSDTIPLVRMNNWRYHWQGYYYYPKPVKVPSSHKLQSKHYYDNRASNTELLTDPTQAVSFGTKTTDEMLFDDFVWMTYKTGDENIDLAAISAKDTIYSNGLKPKPYEKALSVVTTLSVGIESYTDILNLIDISPNPATDKISISIGKPSVYVGRIFNITGQNVLNTEIFTDKLNIDLQHIPVGLYILEIIDTKTNNRVTKKIIKTN